jgi:hypothetical protein
MVLAILSYDLALRNLRIQLLQCDSSEVKAAHFREFTQTGALRITNLPLVLQMGATA